MCTVYMLYVVRGLHELAGEGNTGEAMQECSDWQNVLELIVKLC